jgi:hypothetical protein
VLRTGFVFISSVPDINLASAKDFFLPYALQLTVRSQLTVKHAFKIEWSNKPRTNTKRV